MLHWLEKETVIMFFLYLTQSQHTDVSTKVDEFGTILFGHPRPFFLPFAKGNKAWETGPNSFKLYAPNK